MQFEYEIRLKDGRLVNVSGEADLNMPCDDNDKYVGDIEIESAVEVVNDESWLDIQFDSKIRTEIESKIAGKLFWEVWGEE